MHSSSKLEHKVAIVVVTYNGQAWIDTCLQNTSGYVTVVVDNNSTDDTVSIIQDRYPHVHLIQNPSNNGFGQANNLGIQYGIDQGMEYIFLLNQDAQLHAQSMDVLVAASRQHSEFGIVSPVHLNGDGSALDYRFDRYVAYVNNKSLIRDAFKNELNELYEVPFVNAAGWLIPTEVFLKVGGFDPEFFMYGEDDNLCQRMQYHGFKIGIAPRAFMNHDREPKPTMAQKMSKTEYFAKRKIGYLCTLGNINNDTYEEAYKKIRKNLLRSSLKNLMLLRTNKAILLWREMSYLKSLLSKVEESRNRNKHFAHTYFSEK